MLRRGGRHLLLAMLVAGLSSCATAPFGRSTAVLDDPSASHIRTISAEVTAEPVEATAPSGDIALPAVPSETLAAPTVEMPMHIGTSPMTLAEWEALALVNNPSIPQAAAIARKAMGVRQQIGRRANPLIGYRGEEIGEEGSAGQQGVFVSQIFVKGDKLAWNEAVADQEVQALLWQVETQRRRVLTDVRGQFYATVGAQERVKVAEDLLELSDEALKTAKVLREGLLGSQPDVNQAQVQRSEVQIILQTAKVQHNANWRQLANLAGVPLLETVPLTHELETIPPSRDQATEWANISAQSPRLQQAYAQAQQAHTRIGREQAQPIPNWQVSLGLSHGAITDDTLTSVQIGLPVPIHNRNTGNINRAAAEYQRACWDVQRLERQMQSQLAETLGAYEQARTRATIVRDQILPRQRETLDLIESVYPEQFGFLRLLTARQNYFQARVQLLDALVALHQAEVALDGLLLDGSLAPINDTQLDDSLRDRALSGR